MIYSIRSIIASLLGMLLIAGAAHAQVGKKYRIKLDRPFKDGDTYTISSKFTFEQRTVIASQGAVLHRADSSYSVELVADVLITKRTGPSRRSGITYTVQRCVRADAIDTVELLSPGTELYYAMGSGSLRLVSSDVAVDDSVLAMVKRAIDDVSDRPADRDIGIGKPLAVGETWKINSAKLQGLMDDSNTLKFNRKDVSVIGKLVSVTSSATNPSMLVQVDIDMGSFRPPVPPLIQITRSNMLVQNTRELPIDETKGPISTSLLFEASAKGKGRPQPDLPEIDLDIHVVVETITEYSYK